MFLQSFFLLALALPVVNAHAFDGHFEEWLQKFSIRVSDDNHRQYLFTNWLGNDKQPKNNFMANVKIRSSSMPFKAQIIVKKNGILEVFPDVPISSVAPGQASVFYDGHRVLGGGWIMREETAE